MWLCGGSDGDDVSDGGIAAHALHAACAALSAAVSGRLAAAPGATFGLLGLNTPEYLAALLAGADAGCVAAPLNWRWSAAELAAALALVEPAFVFVDGPCLALLRQAAARPECPEFAAVVLTPLGGGARPEPVVATAAAGAAAGSVPRIAAWRSAGELAGDAWRRPQQQQPGMQPQLQLRAPPDGAALVCFTSGTTSAPKGAVLTHAALAHQSMAKLAVVGYCAADAYLHAAPLCHIGGLSSALAALLAGARHVFAPRFSPAVAAALIRRHRVTALIAVPAMLEDLAAAAAAAAAGVVAGGSAGGQQQHRGGAAALPSVRRLLVGGGGMRAPLEPLVRRLFPSALVASAYGMTEAASSITFLAPALALDGAPAGPQPGEPGGVCVGAPAPGVQVAICPMVQEGEAEASSGPFNHSSSSDRRDGCSSSSSSSPSSSSSATASIVVGEVLTAGPHVMARYWRDAAQTRAALLPGGWLRTGDLGWLDAKGRLWLLGRAKDTVKSGGENVHAREVERALEAHPAVLAAAVVGLPDARLGETVRAAHMLWCCCICPFPPLSYLRLLGLKRYRAKTHFNLSLLLTLVPPSPPFSTPKNYAGRRRRRAEAQLGLARRDRRRRRAWQRQQQRQRGHRLGGAAAGALPRRRRADAVQAAAPRRRAARAAAQL